MKKKLLMALILTFVACMLSFTLIACGDGSGNSSGGEGGSTPPDSIQQGEILSYKLINNDTEYEVVDVAATCTDTDIEIPSTYKNLPVTSIGNFAFKNCTSFTSVVIPDNVKSIGYEAFYDCTSLTSIEIPSSVTSIDCYAFSSCDSLTSIVIPNNVSSMKSNVFSDNFALTIYCEAESIPSGWDSEWNKYSSVVWNCNNNDVAEDGYIYTVVDGVRYSLKDNVATVVKQQRKIITANIQQSITYKDNNYRVTSIGYGAFNYCRSLTSIEIPSSVTSINDDAFDECTALTKVNYLGIEEEWAQIFFYDSFSNPLYYAGKLYIQNQLLTEMIITTSVTTYINDYAFYNCDSLTSVEIGNSVRIGAHAFSNCDSLTSVEIGNNTQINSYVFEYCTSLTSVVMPEEVEGGSYMFRGCEALTIYCEAESKPSGLFYTWNVSNCPVVWGYYYVFNDGVVYGLKDNEATVVRQSRDITTIDIKSSINYSGTTYSVTSIGESAFADCTKLESIVIPNSVTRIDDLAFANCNSLISVTFEEGSQLLSIGNVAFSSCSMLTSIIIPRSVEYIESQGFTYCYSLTIYCEAESDPKSWDDGWNFSDCPVYWYSESQPTAEGNYWHYVDGIVTKW